MSKQTLFSILIFLQLLQMSCNDSNQSLKNTTMNKLALKIEVEKKAFTVNDTIFIKATLINQSPDMVLINNRFLIGYEEQDDREIYFKIFSANGKRYDLPKDHQTDILPLAPTKTNMQQLAPSANIKSDIELTLLNQFKEPGKYKVVGVYESKPFENTQGVYQTPVCSDTLEIEILK
jgi:hypothetical protein